VIVIKTWISISLKIGRYETNSLPAKDFETSKLREVYNWSLWRNWFLADMYAPDHIQEYFAIRTACAVFDMSPIPKYHIQFPEMHNTALPSMAYTYAVLQPIQKEG
jgi:glycine cleavage system aminomethyltransferase T